MPWFSIGTVNPSGEWQTFDEPIFGPCLLRITQGMTDPYNSAWISQYFTQPAPGGRFRPFKKIYPIQEPILFELTIPQGLDESANWLYLLQIRRKYPFYPTPWNISAEVFY